MLIACYTFLMENTKLIYTLLVILVGVGRLAEMRISRRHQRDLAGRGVERIRDPFWLWMVTFHVSMLVACVVEVWVLDRPFIPLLAVPMFILFVLANLLRWWVIRTMAEHWNVQIMNSVKVGVVSDGPFRYIRHPNYAAVFLELLAIPLMHTAWLTALIGAVVHVLVLRQRIRTEEAMLLASPAYRAAMGNKPRFIPRFGSLSQK
jgi:methyltransferase